MRYSIREVSELAGVSARTLRYYDEIGLLKPLEISETGYRYYGEQELTLLQQILFYRERGMELKQIQKIIYQSDFDVMRSLQEHLLDLEAKKKHMESLIFTVEQTIRSMKGECEMSDKEKFQAFKERIVLLHKEWLGKTWKQYTKDAHIAIGNMYISDERFKLYYDKEVAGCATFLEKAIRYWVERL